MIFFLDPRPVGRMVSPAWQNVHQTSTLGKGIFRQGGRSFFFIIFRESGLGPKTCRLDFRKSLKFTFFEILIFRNSGLGLKRRQKEKKRTLSSRAEREF